MTTLSEQWVWQHESTQAIHTFCF